MNPDATRPNGRGANPRRAFTLLEMLIVVALISILVAAIVPSLEPSIAKRLESTAQVVASDVAYTRDLALSGGSTYRLTFDPEENRYILEHSGANTLLDALPPSPYGEPNADPSRQITDFDELPHLGPSVELAAAYRLAPSPESVLDVELGPLGGTTRSEPTSIWLAAGRGSNRRYISILIDPVTGLTTIGEVSASIPGVPY